MTTNLNPEPSQGRIVLTFSNDPDTNGSETCPAIVTNVIGPECVDLYVFDYSNGPRWIKGCGLYASKEEASGARRVFGQTDTCFWPPRV